MFRKNHLSEQEIYLWDYDQHQQLRKTNDLIRLTVSTTYGMNKRSYGVTFLRHPPPPTVCNFRFLGLCKINFWGMHILRTKKYQPSNHNSKFQRMNKRNKAQPTTNLGYIEIPRNDTRFNLIFFYNSLKLN